MFRRKAPTNPQSEQADHDRHFRTDHLKADLGGRAARGLVVTVASQVLKFSLMMVGTVILARLLTPQDYGLVGMVAVVTGFISMFKDLGLSAATIQKDQISGDQVSTLFWVNIGLSVVVTLVTMAIAPAVAFFYGEPRLTMLTIGFSIGFFFGGLTVQHEGLIRRQMRFVALAASEIISLVLGLVAAIVLARLKFSYWALVANQLVQGITYAVTIWLLSGWRPARPVRNAGIRSMLAFGGNLTGFHVVNYFARNLDNMLIGKFWGSRELGLYAKAYQLLLFPIDQINAPISAVAIPALSRLTDAPARYRSVYTRIIEKVAMLTMPGMAFMIATSDWIVLIVLGEQWMEASAIFAWLGIAGLVQPVANTVGWLFISQGRTRDMFRWGIIGSTIIITSLVIGLPWGGKGVATSYSLIYLIIVAPLSMWFVGRSGPVRLADVYHAVSAIALASAAVLAVLQLFRRWVTITNPILGLTVCLAISVFVTLVVLFLLPRGRMALRDLPRSFALLRERYKPV